MKTTMKLAMGSLVVLALLGSANAASAAGTGVVLDPSALPVKARTEIRAEIERARTQTPEAFRRAYDIAARAGQLDEASRVPGAPLTFHFKELGPNALWPMLEMIAYEGHAPAGLTETAQNALRHGLVEAVGMLRDARATPVLVKVLERERDATGAHVASEALARLGTDEAVSALTSALSSADGDRERAILGGLGSCRREAAARLLAHRLDAHPEEPTARVLAKALGGVGNAWAWKTLPSRSEELKTRELASRALLRAFMAYTGAVRQQAANSILLVDEPTTPAQIGDARKSAPIDKVPALDDLEKRFARNPAR